MAGLSWETVGRLHGMGLGQGLGRMSSLGALAGKGSKKALTSLLAAAETAKAAKARINRDLPRLQQAAGAIEDYLSQAQRTVQSAQDYASQSEGSSALSLLDRLGTSVSKIEDLAAQAQGVLDKAGTVPNVPAELVGDPSDPVNVQAWIDAGTKFDGAFGQLRALQGQAGSALAQVNAAAKQIQAAVSRELQAAQQAAYRQQQQEMMAAQREAQQQARQAQLEAQRAAMEAQQQAALYAPPPPLPPLPDPYAQQALPPPPAGYQYAYPGATGAQQGGPQYAPAAVQYAEQPAQWAAQSPQSFIPAQGQQVPQGQPTGPWGLPQGWTSIEYDQLMQGESQYLRGLRGLGLLAGRGLGDLGAGAVSVGRGSGATRGAFVMTPTGGQSVFNAGSMKSLLSNEGASSGPSSADIAAIITATGQAAGSALPAFFPGRQPAPEPLPPARSGPDTSTVLGVLGVAAAVGVGAYLLSGSKKTSSRRRR